MSRLGKTYTFRPGYGGAPDHPVTGKVIWEHPQGRFVVLEYEAPSPFGARRLRESVKTVQGALYGASIDPGRTRIQPKPQTRAAARKRHRRGK